MPRNLSGVYTLPAGNPVVPGTTIDANWANSTLADISNELTNSLSRTGAGGMLAPFRIDDGNVTGPGLAFLNETNTGYFRSGAGATAFSVLGVSTLQLNTTAVTVPSNRTLNAQGNALVGGTLGVTGVAAFGSSLAVTGALTATGGVLGNITAASGTSTFNDVVITGSLDMTVGSSATITGLSTPTNASDAANKGYVDAQVATRLALTGGTMSGAIAMSTNKITGLGTPTADTDAATKAYVDSVAQGLDVKGSVRAATVGNITLSGAQTIDGVAVIAGDRVLVKDQSTAANNGIYVAAAGAWSRAADADTWAELVGAFVFVEDGTVNDNSGWVCTSPPGGTLGVTAVTFEQFSGAGQINAGTGMTKNGNTLNVNTASSSRIVVGADEIDLAQTGVTAGTYKSVTVDLYGRVTAGTNPTTLAGYGIGDAYTTTQTDALLAQRLALTGGTMSGALAMGTNRITGVGDPVNAQDAATKNYIDTIFGSTATAAASAAAAAASASAASTSASNASTSASNASSSASAAATSASNAATSLFNFRAQYLGPLASDPTVDGNGNAVTTGDLYFNTVANETRVYNGSAWVAAYVPSAIYLPLTGGTLTGPLTVNVNSSSDAVRITQTGSGNALYIEDVAADATPFVVSSTGVVGIGTTTPDNVTSAGIALVSNNGFFPQVIQRNKANDTTASYLVFDKDRAGSIVQNGDALGAIVWRSFDGANYLQSAAIIAYSDGAPGTNDVPGRIGFFTTADGASSPTERMSINNAGAITLNAGTANGVAYLNGSKVLTTGSALTFDGTTLINTGPLKVGNGAGTNGSRLMVNNATNTATGIQLFQDGIESWVMGMPANSAALTWAASGAEQMRLTSTGLGIGTSSPSTRLHVENGNILVRNSTLATSITATSNQNTAYTSSFTTNWDENILLISAAGKKVIEVGGYTAADSLRLFTGNTERARISSGGDFLVACTTTGVAVDGCRLTSSPVAQFSRTNADVLSCNRNGTDGAVATFYKAGTAVGTISVTGSATAYNTSSDYRLKNNQQPLTGSGAFIDALKPKTWNWKADGSKGVGFIAHEVQEVSPGSVVGTKDAVDEEGKPVYQAMEYGSAEFIANIIAELQSLRARVAQLEAK